MSTNPYNTRSTGAATQAEEGQRFQRTGADGGAAEAIWSDRSRVMLQPIAPPSVLGLFAFAGATFIVAAQLAGWYGTARSRAGTTRRRASLESARYRSAGNCHPPASNS